MRHKVTDVVYRRFNKHWKSKKLNELQIMPPSSEHNRHFVHLAYCYTYRVQMSEWVTYSSKRSSWQQVLSNKYQYQYQYQRAKYQYKYQYLACKYKYKYQYPKIVLKYRSSTSTSTQYNKTGTWFTAVHHCSWWWRKSQLSHSIVTIVS